MRYNILFRFFILLILLLSFTQSSFKKNDTPVSEVCLSEEEYKLYQLIMKYRKSKKLPSIPLSKSLTFVAQTHTKDLMENYKFNEKCNMHTWSNKGKWSSCCYTGDMASAECMWKKPKELTSYQSNGYEISFMHSNGATAENALKGWQESSAHNAVITNKDFWKKVHWNAIGISIYKNYSCVWFGTETDAEGEPEKCK